MLNFERICSLLTALVLVCGSTSSGYGVEARGQTTRPARALFGSPGQERGSVAVDQALRDLSNPFTVLSIAARPGETDDGTLALCRKGLGARTVMLYATRGEAGDRSTCADNDPEAGFTRTREAVESARLLGADVYFMNLRDFGHSKSANEALSVWGHDKALASLAGAIRALRPDVIITNHNAKTGDGQQQALAALVREAFREAANAHLPTEAGSDPWQVRRLFEKTVASSSDVVMNLSEHDAARGLSYAEIGSAARPGSAPANADGEKSYYKLLASATGEKLEPGGSLLSGLTLPENLGRSITTPRVGDLSLLEATNKPSELVDALREKLLEKRAEGSADDLRARYGPEFVRVIRFTASLERALALLMGFSLEVTVNDRVVVAGQKIVARAVFRNGSSRVTPVVLRTPESLSSTEANPSYKDADTVWVAPRASSSKDIEYEIPKDLALTMPRAGHLGDEKYYPTGSWLPGAFPIEPFGNRLVVLAHVGLEDVSIPLAALARYDTSSPVEILTAPFVILKDWSKPREIEVAVRVRNRTPGTLSGALWVVPLALTDDDYEPARLSFARADEEIPIKLKLKLPILKPPLAPDVLIEFRREKPSSPEPLGLAKIVVAAIGFEVSDDLRVGYISARGSWLAEAFYQLGVGGSEVAIEDIAISEHGAAVSQPARCGDLSRFDTIVVDSCAYFTHPQLILKNECLLKYAREGGNLVVLDQRPDDWNLILGRSQFAPFPIKLSNDRISAENTPVRILDEDHPLMSKPNKIIEKDFDGWGNGRAVNLPRSWSTEYSSLLESNDPGEAPGQGGLLVARVGEGSYVFTSFNWRSQVLTMNAGAYRMLANLVSLPRTNSRPRRVLGDKPNQRQ
ncbi:MAG TPA: PIG-L family deacetylase [Blastocatellia bacterium]|nr:PIG-L family deacetylase [Blastocatellia bacterium]